MRHEEFVDPFEGVPGGIDFWVARDNPLEPFSYRRFVDRWSWSYIQSRVCTVLHRSPAGLPLSSISSLRSRLPSSPKKRLNAATITPGPKSFPVGHATQTSSPAARCSLTNGIALGKIVYRRKLERVDTAAGRDIRRMF